jgi:hypothetical protein
MSDATCFRGHNLYKCIKKSAWHCSMCGHRSPSKISLNNCSKCDFDACPACAGSGVCNKGHPLSGYDNLAATFAECSTVTRCLSCYQCKYYVCEACSVTLKMDEIRIGYAT